MRLPDGREVQAALAMPDLTEARRFAVTWTGPEALDLRGVAGATTVSAAEPGPATGGDAGWMTELGTPGLPRPLLAQVYTYPADDAAEVTLQAASSAQLCGQRLNAQTISSRFGRAEATGLSVDFPECAAGPVVMDLKNLDQDVKVASL